MPDHPCQHEGELATLSLQSKVNADNIATLSELHKLLLVKLDLLIPAVARLEVKSGFYGALGGILAALLIIGISIAAKLM